MLFSDVYAPTTCSYQLRTSKSTLRMIINVRHKGVLFKTVTNIFFSAKNNKLQSWHGNN